MRLRLWVPILSLALVTGFGTGCSKKSSPEIDTTTTEPGDGTGDDRDRTDIGTEQPGAQERNPSEALQDVYFDFDRYEIRADARRVLQSNAGYLTQENTDLRVNLEGHCDERGTAEYNLALGQRRADAVKAYLRDLGVEGNRLSTVSFGEEKPFSMGSSEEAWAKNRRVHFDPSAS